MRKLSFLALNTNRKRLLRISNLLFIIFACMSAAVVGQVRNTVICQGNTETIECDEGKVIHIHHAYYGREDDSTCLSQRGIEHLSCAEDSHDIIWSRCENSQRCELTATDADMSTTRCAESDRKFYHKYISIEYRCEIEGRSVIGECNQPYSWGSWISADNPAGAGDVELKRDHQHLRHGCELPTGIDVQLKEGGHYHLGNDVLQIGLNYGASCYHDRQTKFCNDYKVRYCCRQNPRLRCDNPGVIRNGFMSRRHRKNFRPGESIRYRCSRGYSLVGDALITCNNDLKWFPGIPKCQRTVLSRGAVCKAFGSLHIIQFDSKQRQKLLGKCSYRMAETRNAIVETDRQFSVEIINSENKNRRNVPSLIAVRLKLQNGDVEIVLERGGIIKVEGHAVTSIVEDLYKCMVVGESAKCTTKFGLRVSFNGKGLTINLDDSYKNQVFGICGNFNDVVDDLNMESGNIASNFNLFAHDHETQSCESPPGNDTACSTEKSLSQWREKCDALIDGSIFGSCKDGVDPQPYYEACVRDQCSSNGDESFLVSIFEEYAQDCLDVGIPECEWRIKSGFKELSCPRNSRYGSCSSQCQTSCSGGDSDEERCDRLMETCVCRPGFIKDGTKCVRRQKCGCTLRGAYFSQGETRINAEGFSCKCRGRNEVDCSCAQGYRSQGTECVRECEAPKVFSECVSTCPKTCLSKFDIPEPSCPKVCNAGCECPKGTVLLDKFGQKCVKRSECPKQGVCRAWGDPHYVMFEGTSTFDYMGLCPYILSETMILSRTDKRWFSVRVVNEERRNISGISWVKNALILLDGGDIEILLERDGAKVNGEKVSDAVFPQFKLRTSGRVQRITSECGVTVIYNQEAVIVKLPQSYRNQVEGLCGDFNGDPSDDLKMANGVYAKTFTEFAESYLLEKCNADPGQLRECSEEEKKRWSSNGACGSMVNRNGVFSSCINAMSNAQSYFESCVFDMCATGGDEKMLLESLFTYFADCKEKVPNPPCGWRSELGLDQHLCPANSTYEDCPTSCPKSCFQTGESNECGELEAGCVCDEGFARENTRCIPESQCGCLINGRYFARELALAAAGPNQICSCSPKDGFNCECIEGYIEDGEACRRLSCADNICHPNAKCEDLEDEIKCTCPEGFQGDGRFCELIACSNPPEVENASYLPLEGPYPVGSSVQYTCHDRYTMQLSGQMLCTPQRIWVGLVRCIPNSCEDIANITGGTISITGKGIGDSVTYECNLGYTLQGNGIRECQDTGNWSGTDPYCERICRDDMVYSECVGCPATCIDEFDIPERKCSLECKAGCVCPEGEILVDRYHDTCVPISNCPNRRVCKAYGDPHYISFDRSLFDFMGVCTYIMSETVEIESNDERWYSIQVENEERNNVTGGSWVNNARIILKGGEINILLTKQGSMINGEMISDASSEWYTLRTQGRAQHVTTSSGLAVTFNGNAVILRAPVLYRNKVRGICGDFNGNATDDTRMSNGDIAINFTVSSKSFRVGECEKEPGRLRDCSDEEKKTWSDYEFCGSLLNSTGVFKDCVDAMPMVNRYFDSCIFDMCATAGDKETLLLNLMAYFDACEETIVNPPCDWRESLGIEEQSCPPNSVFIECPTSCQKTCFNRQESDKCLDSITGGCFCEDGFLREGNRCITEEACGCVHDGRYFPKGSQIQLNDSNEICECPTSGAVQCKCMFGYLKDGDACRRETCDDNVCDINAECINKDNTVECKCKTGFSGNGRVCEGIICEKPPVIEMASHESLEEQYSIGSVVRYMCSEGYKHINTDNVICSDTGAWVGIVQCTRILCQELPEIVKGRITQDSGRVISSSAIYECDPGHILRGASTRICQKDGTWSGVAPYCEEIFCGDPPQVQFASYTQQSKYGVGSSVEYNCDRGHKHEQRSTMICTDRGVWIGLVKCVRSECENLPELENGFIQYDSTKTIGSAVTIGCDDGYILIGETKRECNQNGEWSGTTPSCRRISCSDPPFVELATFEPQSKPYPVNSAITYTCADGYRHAQASTMTCTEMGIWVGLVKCTRTTCAELPELENGIVIYSSNKEVSSTVSYKCDSGYRLRGELERSCQSNGEWSGSQPVCERICPEDMIYTDCMKNNPLTCLDKFDLPVRQSTSCKAGCECPGETVFLNRYNTTCVRKKECPKRGVCRVWGDPHYIMFDGSSKFDYMRLCTYTLLEPILSIPRTDERWFTVESDNELRRNIRAGSFVKSARIQLDAGNVIIVMQKDRVTVNDEEVTDMNTPFFNLRSNGRTKQITTVHGVTIIYNGNAVIIRAPPLYRNQVMGMCGDFNDYKNDDFKTRDGVITSNLDDFARSYQVGDCQSNFFDTAITCTDDDKQKWSDTEFCGQLNNATGIFTDCVTAMRNAKDYYESCLIDMCASEGEKQTLIESISAFVNECRQGTYRYTVPCDWRSKLGLDIEICPQNSKFLHCPKSCPRTCFSGGEPSSCEDFEEGRCECDDGYVLEGFECVLLNECGCVINGRYFRKDTYFDDYEANETCTCYGASNFSCDCMPGYVPGEEGCRAASCEDNLCHQNAECEYWDYGIDCQCAEGYSGDGWYECEPEISCESPEQLRNGVIEFNFPPYNVSKVLKYSCNTGFMLEGEDTRICEADGSWSSPSPICVQNNDAVLCLPPRRFRNGVISHNFAPYRRNKLLIYDCNFGYRLLGRSTRTCQWNGKWSNAAPVCVKR